MKLGDELVRVTVLVWHVYGSTSVHPVAGRLATRSDIDVLWVTVNFLIDTNILEYIARTIKNNGVNFPYHYKNISNQQTDYKTVIKIMSDL